MIKNLFNLTVRAVAASTLLVFAACHQNENRITEPAQALPVAKVRAEKAELHPLVLSEEVVGTVRAKTHATLEAKYAGRIEKFPKKLGDKVRAGELVVELDIGETAARLEQAEASVEQAERDWKRVSALFDANSATRAERDSAESRLRLAKASLAEARASLGQARIVAPFDGVITKKFADAGDFATPGRPLLEIVNPAVLQVEIDIPESLPARVDLDSKLSVVGERGISVPSAVVELSPSVDPSTRTRRAKIELKEGSFTPGQFVRVSIPLTERKALLLPKTALVERGQLEIVFTMEKQHARMHLVKTRPHTDGRIEILSGLGAGELVIVEGAHRLVDGQPVEAN